MKVEQRREPFTVADRAPRQVSGLGDTKARGDTAFGLQARGREKRERRETNRESAVKETWSFLRARRETASKSGRDQGLRAVQGFHFVAEIFAQHVCLNGLNTVWRMAG